MKNFAANIVMFETFAKLFEFFYQKIGNNIAKIVQAI